MDFKAHNSIFDFVLLENPTEEEFYKNLTSRYSADQIYTYIGDVVVSVNPYKTLDIYKDSDIKYYDGRPNYDVAPHVYSVANSAFHEMVQKQENQCVIISGESGSGKTEASKILMNFIAAVSKNHEKMAKTKEMLLQSNPVLEAFGNAKTIRNDNSSRFGKYMEIQFDRTGAPIGGKITNYLLEKSRVVTRAENERNFHIFYQMLAGMDEAKLKKLFLTNNPNDYFYLSNSNCVKVDTINDKLGFKQVRSSLKTIGFSDSDCDFLWNVLAAILLLGNVKIDVNPKKSTEVVIRNKDIIKSIASLLDIDPFRLDKAICYRTITSGMKAKSRESTIFIPLNLEQATFARNALAKNLYYRLFQWLVSTLNSHMQCPPHSDPLVIGVLDIYGFEVLGTNSFEQFCINLCNEKLQQVHIELTLKAEQDCYLREGINWTPVKYFNNRVICDFIEKQVIPLLDDECTTNGSDQAFFDKMEIAFKTNEYYSSYLKDKDRSIGTKCFKIKHYAGDVIYSIEGFLEKNIDTFYSDLFTLIQSSSNNLISGLFPVQSQADLKKRPPTLATQFKQALADLVDSLMRSKPHYIRCIKPNETKKPGVIDQKLILHQIRYLGLLENLRVRRAGFVFRQSFVQFVQRFKMLNKKTWPNAQPNKESCKIILEDAGIKPDEYQFGKSMVFIKSPRTVFRLEELRSEALPKVVTIIQAAWRGYIVREKRKRKLAAIKIQSYYRGYACRKVYKQRKAAFHILLYWRTMKAFVYINKIKKSFENASLSNSFGRDVKWPDPPAGLSHASKLVHQVWKCWWAFKLINSLPEEEVSRMRQKTIAYTIMPKKWDYSRKFETDYLNKPTNPARENYMKFINGFLQQNNDTTICYSDSVNKINRHGKAQKRAFVITDKSFYKHDPSSYSVKNALELKNIKKIIVSNYEDGYAILVCDDSAPDFMIDCNSSGENRLAEFVSSLYMAYKSAVGGTLPVEASDSIEIVNQPKGPKAAVFPVAFEEGSSISLKKAKKGIIVCAPKAVPARQKK